MGLDMYLTAKRYLWDGKDAELINVIKAEGIDGIGEMTPKEIACRAMYWRKANAIHKWFVDNVQDGEDECQEHEVSHEQLAELANLCRKVWTQRGETTELLPPTEGFFFGKAEIDDYYWEYVNETAEQIEKLLSTKGIDDWAFYYCSSW